MSQKISFTVPLVPPSVNHYVKHTRSGKHYVTKEAKAFTEAVTIIGGRNNLSGANRYEVEAHIYLGKSQSGDVDNFGKMVCDSLVKSAIIDSDAKISKLTLIKSRDKENPRTDFTIEAIWLCETCGEVKE